MVYDGGSNQVVGLWAALDPLSIRTSFRTPFLDYKSGRILGPYACKTMSVHSDIFLIEVIRF